MFTPNPTASEMPVIVKSARTTDDGSGEKSNTQPSRTDSRAAPTTTASPEDGQRELVEVWGAMHGVSGSPRSFVGGRWVASSVSFLLAASDDPGSIT
jgi:hypothetical protein